MEGPQSAGLISTVESLSTVYKVKFSATYATQRSYGLFIKNLINALIVHGSASHGIPVLPSDEDLQPTDLRRYVVVELDSKGKNVSLVIEAPTVYLLGYRPGLGTYSYFFSDVPEAVRNLFFHDTNRRIGLDFESTYPSLEVQAKVDSRDQIPLGFAQLRKKINKLNVYNPAEGTKDEKKLANLEIAQALIVCIEMISEAARFKVIQQQLAALAPLVEGGPDQTLYKPEDLDPMIRFQNSWTKLSNAIQNANPDGTFKTNVTINQVPYSNVNSVRPLIAILKKYLPGTTVLDQVVDAGVGSECELEGETTHMQ